jgi:hypothetical protein
MHGENDTHVVLHVQAGETAGDCLQHVQYASAALFAGVGLVTFVEGDVIGRVIGLGD